MQRQFATNAAHELRTPLASIVTAVEMLQTGAKDEPETRDEFLGMIERESDRLTRLTPALLVLARAGARDELPSLGAVPVEPLLEQVAASLPRRPGSRRRRRLPEPARDRRRCRPPGTGALEHRAERRPAHGHRPRHDAGPPRERARRDRGRRHRQRHPAPDQARIFDRFYRAGDRDGGFGLGLSIAREAVRTLGGEIELESEQSVGTTVRITLQSAPAEPAPARPVGSVDPTPSPAANEPDDLDAHEPERTPGLRPTAMPPPARPSPRRPPPQPKETDVSPRILVVDDEPSLVRGLTYALERDKFEVEVATDGEAAVDAALTQGIDLVILDLMLPKLSGEEACRRIRAESDVPIIMLTAKDSERDLLSGLELGADDYVTKPFSAAELIGRVGALLRRRKLDHAASEQVVRTVGAIKIDLVRDEVSVEGKQVALTPSEFKILGLLAGSPGAAYTRRQIMEHLWGSTFTADEHTCEVHVSALRRKIERDPASPERLVTVRGVGYALRAG